MPAEDFARDVVDLFEATPRGLGRVRQAQVVVETLDGMAAAARRAS